MTDEKATRRALDNLKKSQNLRTDKEVAEFLGVGLDALKSWLRRDIIPHKFRPMIEKYSCEQAFSGANISNSAVVVNGAAVNVVGAGGDSEELAELFELIRQYATPNTRRRFKEHLLKIKALEDEAQY